MKTVTLPPYAPTLIESTRSIGYTLESAIADIVDNSVSASASFTDIFFFPIGEAYIAILDNGEGMDAVEIETAMRYGSQNPNNKRAANDLGRFGLGLKTASLSQCRTLTVASKQGIHIEARRWDIDHVAKTGDWSLIILDTEEELSTIPRIEKLRKYESGTLVVWQNLDRLKVGEMDFNRSMGKKMDAVRAHLSLVFHRYISGEPGLKRMQIRMNDKFVESADPFLSKRNTQVMSDEIMDIDGSRVVVRAHILPHISNLSADEIALLGGKEDLRRSQGFYVYRNKRLLVWGTWFHMMRQGELSKLARVQVDIPNALDSLWTLDIKKSTAMPPEVVRNNLISVIERLAEQSKRTWVFRGKKETSDSIIHIWNRFKGKQGGHYYAINRDHPLVEILTDTSPQIKHNVEALLSAIETGIPLNQLYLDLTSEKRVENDSETTAQEVEATLKALLDQLPTEDMRKSLLDKLEVSDPFVNYPKIIERYNTGGAANGRN
ncbi:ATP-binding protein [Dehalococcoides mccartyi]|uniref:ATP-binding protein n=1 Tax=Dehalococcoides mccartyi TaxID=61435 RepID=UPI0002B768A6|nr:ATP-binding protein [Dehalococcoides mccartyi]AGG05895.1 putative ATPase [Dehalococcoides mccartyi DCMB5]